MQADQIEALIGELALHNDADEPIAFRGRALVGRSRAVPDAAAASTQALRAAAAAAAAAAVCEPPELVSALREQVSGAIARLPMHGRLAASQWRPGRVCLSRPAPVHRAGAVL